MTIRAKIEITRTYSLTMDEAEARALKSLLQNPLTGFDNQIRANIWRALDKPEILPDAMYPEIKFNG